MATIRDLLQMSQEELWQAHLDKKISDSIRNHKSQDTIKPLALIGFYTDCGNFAGSLVMFMLLFPEEFGVSIQSILPLVDGAGDRADVLRHEGNLVQKSGRGVNNYRTNLLEALIIELGDQVWYTQKLWECVAVRCVEDFDASWSLTQKGFIVKMLASNEQVTACQRKTASFQTCTELDLDLNAYYISVKKIAACIVARGDASAFPTYYSIMEFTGCSRSASRKLWDAITVLRNKLLHN